MMSKRYVFNEIATNTTSKLINEGFRFIKSKERIIREREVGFDVIIFQIIDYNPIFEIEMSLRTRLNKVEDIVNRFMSDCMNPKFMSLTETINITYQALSNSKENFIRVKTESELQTSIKDIVFLILDKGMPFFQQNLDIQKVNQIKKTQILHEHKGLSINHDRRTLMQSLTLLKLCNDPDFEKLSVKYKELYVPFIGEEETGRNAMDGLIEYLKKLNFPANPL